MAIIRIESFEPSFNRLDFIRYIFNNTHYGLIESKQILDKIIDGKKVEIEIPKQKILTFIEGLNNLKVFCSENIV